MKSKKIKAIFIGIALIASQGALVSLAQAAAFLTLNNFSGTPGSALQVSGGGWTTGDTVDIYFGSVAGTPVATTTVGNDTNFSAPVTIPANEPQGSLNIIGVDTANNSQASNSFYVVPLSPSISVSAPSGTPFATVTVNGTGYAPNETVNITLAGASSTATANGSGAFSGSIVVPSVNQGLYYLVATGESSNASALYYFWISQFYPSASPSTYYILPGESLSFNGAGFAPNEAVSVYGPNGTSSLAQFAANANGGFTNAGSVTIPGSAAQSVITYDLVGASSTARVPVSTAVGSYYPSISPSTYYAEPNSSITVTGNGFESNEAVTISTNNSGSSTQVTADTNGNFTASVVIPFSNTKSATITAHGASSNATTSVNITLASFWPSVTPSSWYLYPGQSATFAGTGFAPNETVAISPNTGSSTSITADATGAFTTPALTIPYNAQYLFGVTFAGSLSDATATSEIAIGELSPYLTSDLYWATQGQTVHVTGFGFGANETVHVTAGSFATDTVANATGTTPAVAIVTPYGVSSLPITFTGDSTSASSSLMIGLGGYVAALTANNYYALPGTQINVTGMGFVPNETVNLFNGSATSTVSANASGTFTTPVTLPLLFGVPSVTLVATGETSGAAANATINFASYAPQVSPSTWFTAPGTNVQFNGSGFAPNETVNAALNGAALSPITASASGTFASSDTIPYGSTSANFNFTGAETNVSVPIAITLSEYYASMQLSTYYAQGGTPLTITGAGFAPKEPINLYFTGTLYASTTADTNGNFTYNGAVPFSPAGSDKPFNAVGAESQAMAGTTITIAPVYTNLQLGAYAGAPGSAIDFIGSGYLPNEPIAIATDRTGTSTVYTFNADGSGSFNNSGYVVPTNFTGGPLVITVTGEHSFDEKSITYYVTGQ